MAQMLKETTRQAILDAAKSEFREKGYENASMRTIAEKAGIRNVYGIAAPSKILYLPNNMFREFFGVVKDILRGNMSVV